jgi:hypothetical protein
MAAARGSHTRMAVLQRRLPTGYERWRMARKKQSCERPLPLNPVRWSSWAALLWGVVIGFLLLGHGRPLSLMPTEGGGGTVELTRDQIDAVAGSRQGSKRRGGCRGRSAAFKACDCVSHLVIFPWQAFLALGPEVRHIGQAEKAPPRAESPALALACVHSIARLPAVSSLPCVGCLAARLPARHGDGVAQL